MSSTLFYERWRQVLTMTMLQGWDLFDCIVVIDCRQTTGKRTVVPVLMDTLPQHLDSIGLDEPVDPGWWERTQATHAEWRPRRGNCHSGGPQR